MLDKAAGSMFNTVIFQCPTEMGKGVLISPTVHGNLLVGPDSQDIDDKKDVDTTRDRLDYVKETAQITSNNIPMHQNINNFAGLRATPDTGDFIIGESEQVKGFINVAGIESPGLSAAPAIAKYVRELVESIYGNLPKNQNFDPYRKRMLKFEELSPEEKAKMVEQNPDFGRIVCRCELVTEAEIVDAIHRKAGATTIDGLKKRVRTGMGRCQGGFCTPRVMEILSRELNIEMSEVVKDSPASQLLTSKTKSIGGGC